MFIFWDLLNDRPEILGDDGVFWAYGEDNVAIERGLPDSQCRYWMKMCKVSGVHPLSEPQRFEVFDPRLDRWVDVSNTDIKTYREIFKLAGAECHE